jgi:hypothetical protein
MEKADLEAGLRRLRQSLVQMKALLAWKKLKQSELRPGQPPSFTIYYPTDTDLRNEYSLFLSIKVKFHHFLNYGIDKISESEKLAIKGRLARIEQEVNRLNLHKLFLYPLENEFF